MANDSLKNLKKKHVQSLVKACIEVKLSAEFSPVTRRFFRRQLETLKVCLLAWQKRNFPSALAIAVGFHECASTFTLCHQLILFLVIQCYHHFYDHKILHPPAHKAIQMKLGTKHRILLGCLLGEKRCPNLHSDYFSLAEGKGRRWCKGPATSVVSLSRREILPPFSPVIYKLILT